MKEKINCYGDDIQEFVRKTDGCRYLIPTLSVVERGGNTVLEDYEFWTQAKKSTEREEKGIIHKKLFVKECVFPDSS